MVIYFSIFYAFLALVGLWAMVSNPKTTVQPSTLWWNSIANVIYAALLFFAFGPLNNFGIFFAWYCVFNAGVGVVLAALGGYNSKRWMYTFGFISSVTFLVLFLTVGIYV